MIDNQTMRNMLNEQILGPMAFRSRRSFNAWVNPNPLYGNDSGSGQFHGPYKTLAKAVATYKKIGNVGGTIFIQGSLLTDPTVGAVLNEGDIDLSGLTDLNIVALNDPTLGSVIIKPSTDMTYAVFVMIATTKRIGFYNLTLDLTGDGHFDQSGFKITGGCNNITMKNVKMKLGKTGIAASTVASCSDWLIEDLRIENFSGSTGSFGISGCFHHAQIVRPVIIRGQAGNDNALVSGITLLDGGTTAIDSDNAIIDSPVIVGNGDGTNKIITNGILIADACEGVTILNARVTGCTDNINTGSGTRNVTISGKTNDGGQGGAEYADTEDCLNS